MTGSTVSPCSTAVWQFATLCALDTLRASNTSSAPSQAARLRRDFVGEINVAGRIDQI